MCSRALGALGFVLVAGAAPARGAQHVQIRAGFSPYRLGASAAMTLGMTVSTDSGEIPSPLTGLDMSYPASLGLATTGLGTASCTAARLEDQGPAGCPRDSIVGHGNAVARFRVGPEIFRENGSIGIVAGPSSDGNLHLLISATGITPVAARIVMASTLAGGHFGIDVPLVPSLPGGENVAVVEVSATLGGKLVYTEMRHGRMVRYTPRGVNVPRRCPGGGFKFSGTFSFMDGTSASADYVLPCPRRP
jgi:hypothetical protein